MTAENFFRTSDGKWLYYERQGIGFPLLFVPGHMCTTKFFEKNSRGLEDEYEIILFDARGYGRSSKSQEENTLDSHARDIKELIDHLEVEKITIFGWSLGASVVLRYIEKYGEEKIAAIGLIDAALYPFSYGKWNSHKVKEFNIDLWTDSYGMWITNPEEYCKKFCDKMYSDHNTTICDWMLGEVKYTYPWTGLELHLDFCHGDCLKVLEHISRPVIIYAGSSKNFPASIEMAMKYKNHISCQSVLVVFEWGGHVLFNIEAEKFNRETKQFLKKVYGGNHDR